MINTRAAHKLVAKIFTGFARAYEVWLVCLAQSSLTPITESPPTSVPWDTWCAAVVHISHTTKRAQLARAEVQTVRQSAARHK
jgi:hypothetical protein